MNSRKRTVVFAILATCVELLIATTFSKAYPADGGGNLDIKAVEANVLAALNDKHYITQGKELTLGDALKKYDDCYSSNDLQSAYSYRAEKWQQTVTFPIWSKLYTDLPFNVKQIITLGASPVPNDKKTSSAFQLVKYAVLENKKTQVISHVYYIEIWVYQHGDWKCFGGAVWDNPNLPILTLDL